MNRIMKTACLLLAALLLLAGCSAPPENGESAAPRASLTALQYEIENIDVDFSSMWYFQQIEQQTGIHVDFTEIKDSEWSSSVSLAVRGWNARSASCSAPVGSLESQLCITAGKAASKRKPQSSISRRSSSGAASGSRNENSS